MENAQTYDAFKNKLTQKKKKKNLNLKKNAVLYLLLLPAIALMIYLNYLPMIGVSVAFMDYNFFQGFSSPWVGFDNFIELFSLPMFGKAVFNTVYISLLNLVIVFPIPIIFALLLNEVKFIGYKRVIQTLSYMPHFISWVAVIGIAHSIFSSYGFLNDIRVAIFGEGTERINFLAEQGFFVPNVVGLTIWKGFGWSSIIYLAAITGIDPELYEAASVDGANKFRQVFTITIPSILPTIVMLFILKIGTIFGDNFGLIYGLQNPFIDFETISTVTYKNGIAGGNYSMATAIGLFQGVVGYILVAISNSISKKVNEVSLW